MQAPSCTMGPSGPTASPEAQPHSVPRNLATCGRAARGGELVRHRLLAQSPSCSNWMDGAPSASQGLRSRTDSHYSAYMRVSHGK